MNPTVSVLAEVPEALHESLKGYLEAHPTWDQDKVFTAALALFLTTNGSYDNPGSKRNSLLAVQTYLNTIFQSSGNGGEA